MPCAVFEQHLQWFEPDGRHVRPWVAERAAHRFAENYFEPA
jgi:hypothetical protein